MKIYGLDLNPVMDERPDLAEEIQRMFGRQKPPHVVGVIAAEELRKRYKRMDFPSNSERLSALISSITGGERVISKALIDVLLDTKPTYIEAPDDI